MKAKSSIPLNKSKWIFHFPLFTYKQMDFSPFTFPFSLKMAQHLKGFTALTHDVKSGLCSVLHTHTLQVVHRLGTIVLSVNLNALHARFFSKRIVAG